MNTSTQDIIPIIDLSDPKAGKIMVKACQEHGFFYVDNREGQEIETQITDELFAKSKEFFNLSDKIKNEYAIEKSLVHRGYVSQDSFYVSRYKLTNTDTDNLPNIEKIFDKSKATKAELLRFLCPSFLNDITKTGIHDGNFYPKELGNSFEVLIKKYVRYCLDLQLRILAHLSPYLALDVVSPTEDKPLNNWQEAFTDPLWMLHFNHYPPIYGEFLPHSDRGLLTTLLQDQTGGLQVWFKEKWVDVKPIRNTFVVNVGDMLQEWSLGKLKSTRHQVINSANSKRYSIPFFSNLNKLSKIKLQKETSWYSPYGHLASLQYTLSKYLFENVSKDEPLKGMTPQEIDNFHWQLVFSLPKSTV